MNTILSFQVTLLEEELIHLKNEELERTKVLQDLGSQRDRIALSIANKLAKVNLWESGCMQ